MNCFYHLLFCTLACWFLPTSSANEFPSHSIEKRGQTIVETNPNIIGYEYNLWAIEARGIGQSETLDFSGRIFLDKRKRFKANFSKDEHFYFYRHEFSNEQVFYFPGNTKSTRLIKHGELKDFYIALKFDNEWIHHTYNDIVERQALNYGEAVGCDSCNFTKTIYDKDGDWTLTLYYQISLIYKPGSEDSKKKVERKSIDPKEAFVVLETENSEPMTSTSRVSKMDNSNAMSYHVLVGIEDTPNEKFDDLKGIGPIFKETFDSSGSTRYFIGSAYSYSEILSIKQQVEAKGYENLLIAKYRNGMLKSFIEPK